MATEQAPAFQFYARDWLASGRVAVLSLEQRGAYITLLTRCWLMVTLPKCPRSLAALAGASPQWWKRHGAGVMALFTETPTGFRHDRLDEEREKQAEYSRQQSERAQARWNHAGALPRQSPGNAEAMPEACSSSSSASASTDQHTPNAREAAPLPTRMMGFPSRRNPHVGHAACGRVCVPADLHAEFRRKVGGTSESESDAKLRAWYPTVLAEWPDDRPIGDDDWTFWRSRFQEWQGTTRTRPGAEPQTSTADLAARAAAKLKAKGEL